MTKQPFSLGSTPGAGYLLAAEITKAAQYFEREENTLRAVLADPPSEETSVVCGQQLERLQAARKRFEAQFLTDPAGAVEELTRVRGHLLDVTAAGNGKYAARDVDLARAVEHVAEWFWQAKAPADKWHFRAMPVACLGPISTMIKVDGEDRRKILDAGDLKKLAEHATVKEALRGDGAKKYGGQKNAAIVLVALATGLGEQTIKRAANPPKNA